ncbi:MarR family transcriptional regulator [Candidatus Micrarchaeota archaeon]|nr:MarR family transcriptional regulator [Candidatus Micrarchaeota archaeon]
MMIDFACKRINMADIIRCSFSLTKTEYKIFALFISSKKHVTVQHIANKLHLDRTTVQKSLKRMMTKNLIIRRQKNLNKGGYVYLYSLKDKHKIKKDLSDIVYGWSKNVLMEIKRF